MHERFHFGHTTPTSAKCRYILLKYGTFESYGGTVNAMSDYSLLTGQFFSKKSVQYYGRYSIIQETTTYGYKS